MPDDRSVGALLDPSARTHNNSPQLGNSILGESPHDVTASFVTRQQKHITLLAADYVVDVVCSLPKTAFATRLQWRSCGEPFWLHHCPYPSF